MTEQSVARSGVSEAIGLLKLIFVWWLHGIGARIALFLIFVPGIAAYYAATLGLGISTAIALGLGILLSVLSLWVYGVLKTMYSE